MGDGKWEMEAQSTDSDALFALVYERESVNRSQIYMKRKICDIRTWEKQIRVFLHISSTTTDTLVPLLYQCVETRCIEVF
jgi:hypothetical protein